MQKPEPLKRKVFHGLVSTATALWPLDAVNAWECQDKTQYKALRMKFSDLWHQGDQTRQSDYVFCEPPKRDGLDTLMKKMWQAPHRSLNTDLTITASQPQTKANLSFSWFQKFPISFYLDQ